MLNKFFGFLLGFLISCSVANAQAIPGFQIKQVYVNPLTQSVVQKQYLATPYQTYRFYQSYDPFWGYNYRYYTYQRPVYFLNFNYNRGYWWR
jgi:hypothetical protein